MIPKRPAKNNPLRKKRQPNYSGVFQPKRQRTVKTRLGPKARFFQKIGLTKLELHHCIKNGFNIETFAGLKKLGNPPQLISRILTESRENEGFLTVCSYLEKVRIGDQETGRWFNVANGTKEFLRRGNEINLTDTYSPEGVEIAMAQFEKDRKGIK